MSYVNENVSSLADLITKLDTFLTGTPGWTQDQLDLPNGQWAIHKNNIYVAIRWDTSSPNKLAIFQALGYTGGQVPGNHPDDSGNGEITGTDANISNERYATVSNTPTQYWAFEDDDYCHIIIQRGASSDTYSHIGFGMLDKIGDWTGGEYCYGARCQIATGSSAVDVRTCMLLDSLCKNVSGFTNAEEYAATIHCEGLPGQAGAGKWAVNLGDQNSANLGTDRATNARVHFTGGFRAGPIARQFGRFRASSLKGLIPFYPMVSLYWNRTTGAAYGPMGFMKDIRGINIKNYAAGDEITVGADTWVMFPAYKKWTSGVVTGTSSLQGIAYKKVTT